MVTYYSLVFIYFAWTMLHDLIFKRIETGAEVRRRLPIIVALEKLAMSTPIWLSGTLLLAGFIVQLLVVEHVTRLQAAPPDWFTSLPVRYIPHLDPKNAFFKIPTMILGIIAFLESCMLFSLYQRCRSRGISRSELTVVGILCAIMYGIAVVSPVMPSADIYAYIGYGRLGMGAYTPHVNAFSGAFSQLNPVALGAWGSLEPAPYGPLFIGFVSSFLGHTPNLFSAFIIERLACLGAVAVIIEGLRRLNFQPALLLALTLNPVIAYEFVVDGHNDILAVALTVVGFVLIEKRPFFAGLAVIAAGLIKLPYVLVASLVFALMQKRSHRLLFAVGTAIVTIILSRLLGGPEYLNGVLFHAHRNVDMHVSLFGRLKHLALGLSSALAVFVALLTRKYFRGAAFAFPGLAAALYPWYIALAFPYAILERTYSHRFVILLPVITIAMDWNFEEILLRRVSLFVLIVIIAVIAIAPRGLQRRSQGALKPSV